MKTITLTLFEYPELNEAAQEIALQTHKDFLIDTFDETCATEDQTQSEYRRTLSNTEVVENIELNEYLYYPNGALASITQYTGKHDRSGDIELTIEDNTYLLN